MIKNQKKKLLTLLMAGVIGTAAFGGAIATSYTAEAAETYNLSTIFTTKSAVLSKEGTEGEAGQFKMELSNEGKVSYTRDLALKWYTEEGAKYMSMDFTLTGTDFTELVFTFETASLTATKDDKAINKVVFTKDGDKVMVAVNDATAVEVANATEKLTLSLAEVDATADELDSFKVLLNSTEIGTFTNIGVNFAEYDTSKKIYSFAVSAKTEGDNKATLLFHEINGQSLALNADGKFEDSAAPVLVVNEEIDGYAIGTAFALDYEVIDVFDRTVTKNLKYYQYDPDDEVADTENKGPEYKTLSTTTYFYETNYTYKDGDTDVQSTVFKKSEGTEYVSIKFELSDDSSKEASYFLDWYLESVKVDTQKLGVEEKADSKYTSLNYIKVYENNEEGAKYTFVTLDDSNPEDLKNVFTENQAYTNFVEALKELEVDEEGNLALSAGEGSYLYLPSMKNMFDDNGGYSNLKFTISYKTTSNNSAKTSSGLSASSLKLEVTEAGIYEFKIFAVDKAGNNMKYYLDGELVDVTSSNVWDIEEIPSFSVKVAHNGLKIEEGSKKKETEMLYNTYDIPSFDIVGSTDAKTEYALFYIDQGKIENTLVGKLSEISYSDIAIRAKTLKADGVEEKGLELYKLAYAVELVGDVEEARELLANAFVEIDEYNEKIDKELHEDEWNNSDNAYEWKPDSRSFIPQATGTYVVLAYFVDPDVAAYDAGAYMVVSVNAKIDSIKGETEWLKNNIASVILFGIAGVMLILIIILLVIKPSDETLEDYDEPVKAEKKAKKEKKAKEDEKALEELDEN